jgi:hypothetical protein
MYQPHKIYNIMHIPQTAKLVYKTTCAVTGGGAVLYTSQCEMDCNFDDQGIFCALWQLFQHENSERSPAR